MDMINEKQPPAYLILLELFCRIPNTLMHVQINNNADIGDIRPINTVPNFSGFLIKTFSASHGKSKRKSRKIKLQ